MGQPVARAWNMPLHRGRRPWAGAIVVAGTWAAVAGCSSSSEPASVCAAGRSVACVGVGGCNGGQVCASDGASFGPCVCQETGTGLIGPSGGVIQAGGASVTVPAGALSTDTTITVTVLSGLPPSPYEACSAFYQFEPAGLMFAVPVDVLLPDYGCAPSAAMYWSKAGGASGYDRLSTDLMAASASAQVTHFSTGFVGRLRPQGAGPDGGAPMDSGSDHDSTISDSGSDHDSSISDVGSDDDSTISDSGSSHDSTIVDTATDTDATVSDSASDAPSPDGGSDAAPPACTGASSCPAGEACNAGVCSTSCGASSPCNGGCCDGVMCQPGTSATACGISGGACTSCSGGTPACGATGTCLFCSDASDCPMGQACTSGSCSTSCSAGSSCNGGCCDGTICQPGTAVGACGSSGGMCASCSGSTPTCSSGACVACSTATDCPTGEACVGGTCSRNGCSATIQCNGACCMPSGCCASAGGSCWVLTGTICNGGAGGETCNPCPPSSVCTAAGSCGCDPLDPTATCPVGDICNGSTGECESTPPASCTSGTECSGTCCDVSTGECGSQPEAPTACGASGFDCVDCTAGGGSCLNGFPAGSAGGFACVGSAHCGCLTDSDCSGCTALTVCNTATQVCSTP
jgi:hypothetical protein